MRYCVYGFFGLLAACASPAPPESVVGDYLSARLAASAQNVDRAAQAFSEARLKAPGSPEIRRNAFYFRLAAGDYDEALAIAEELAADPNAGEGGFAKAVLSARAIKSGRYEEAKRLIRAAREAGFPRPAANIMEVWSIAGAEGDAAALETLRKIPGDEYRGQAGAGRYAGRAGLARLDAGAAPPAHQGATPAEGAAIALYSLASGVLQDAWQRREAAEKAGFRVGEADYNLSLAMARLALYLDPDFDDARRFVGSILNLYGEHEAGVRALSMIRPSSPYYEPSRIEIAGAYEAMDRTDEAIAVLRSFIRENPEAMDARLSLAGLLASKEQHADAAALMDKVIAALPDDPPTFAWRHYVTRAASLIELGEWPRAEADLKRAVEIAPEEATTLNYLGYSWAERGENLDEAFELIEKAVAIEPTSGAIIDSLGWAHYQLGDYEEAVGHLEQAASLEPADPTITDHLGDVYWRLDRPLEARYQWRRVLELEPDDELAASVQEKLERGLPPPDAE